MASRRVSRSLVEPGLVLLLAAILGTSAYREFRDADGALRVSVSSDGATANSTTGNPVVSRTDSAEHLLGSRPEPPRGSSER